MLAVSPLRGSNGDEREREVGGFGAADQFDDGFSGAAMLEDINFDDLFMGFDDGDLLPDLEVDPAELFGDFSVGAGEEDSGSTSAAPTVADSSSVPVEGERKEQRERSPEEEVASGSKEGTSPSAAAPPAASLSSGGARKSSPGKAKATHGKRKIKVDWTPELHRRFVQAVEQLGVDKAVPSRILELMGIDCLTRHNIASHLQKYRSHRKHLLAREAEAASWSQRRQVYGGAVGGAKREMSPWLAPTIGFPPPPPAMQPFRPLHVWGHPSVEQPLVQAPPPPHVWPRHLVSAPRSPVLPPWAPPDPAFWHPHYQRGHREGWVPSALTQGTPCFPPPMRFQAPTVPSILPHPLYRPPATPPPSNKPPGPQNIELDAHPSKESVDAVIGDVLAKPWQPLPLGLKPPSLESVLGELQRQGVSTIPPTCC